MDRGMDRGVERAKQKERQSTRAYNRGRNEACNAEGGGNVVGRRWEGGREGHTEMKE